MVYLPGTRYMVSALQILGHLINRLVLLRVFFPSKPCVLLPEVLRGWGEISTYLCSSVARLI